MSWVRVGLSILALAVLITTLVLIIRAVVVARRIEPDNLYSGWLRKRGINLESGVDRDVLAGLTVADALDRDVVVVDAEASVASLLTRFAWADQTVYPVVDSRRRLLGVLTQRDLGDLARAPDPPPHTLLARDVAHPTEAVTLDISLLEVTRRMGAQGIAALPVVDAPSSRVLGTVGRGGIMARYSRAVAERRG